MFDGGATSVWVQCFSGVLVEWTPFIFVSGAIGGSINWVPFVANGAGGTDSAWGAGVPIRLALNAPVSDETYVDPLGGPDRHRRRAISFSATVTPGYTFAASGFQLGLMGGISFELY